MSVHATTRYGSVFRADLFAGTTALVTGGGSGIGRCVAHELSSLGATVIITGRKIEKLERVAGEISEDGGAVHYAAFDIRDEEAVEGEIAALVDAHGMPSIAKLITNMYVRAGTRFKPRLSF